MENKKPLNRYHLAYTFIPFLIDFCKDNDLDLWDVMSDKSSIIDYAYRNYLNIDGFSWDNFEVDVFNHLDKYFFIIYSFPSPQIVHEALYGAIVVYENNKFSYLTLESTIRPGRYCLAGFVNTKRVSLGLFDLNPTLHKFIELLIGPAQFIITNDVKKVLKLPSEYKEKENNNNDLHHCVVYEKKEQFSFCHIDAFPISRSEAMSWGEDKKIISEFHNKMGDEYGLVEVNHGYTKPGYPYIYNITKQKAETNTFSYNLQIQVLYGDFCLNIQSIFSPVGIPRRRDAIIWQRLFQERKVTTRISSYKFDQYDKNFKHPLLMDISEREVYDAEFPEHPLSKCREFRDYVIGFYEFG